jgi:8-oxo-dGTP pyrophosphatase MutT (NUDIX family)
MGDSRYFSHSPTGIGSKPRTISGIHPAHLDMIPADRPPKVPSDALLQTARQAAVLVLLYPDEFQVLHTVFIRRAPDGGVHSGQIALPGGKLENGESYWQAALRETEEEIGVDASAIEHVHTLSGVYIPPSNFWVQPFVGRLKDPTSFSPDPVEVAEVIPASLVHIHTWQPTTTRIQRGKSGELYEVPAFVQDQMTIWGATAMMLREFQFWLHQTEIR